MRYKLWVVALVSVLFGALYCLPGARAEADPYAALWPRIDGSTATQPLTNAMHQYLTGVEGNPDEPIIQHNRTSEAYWRLGWGASGEDGCDLIFVTAPYAKEWEELEQRYEIIPVVKDALVFLNNQQNPVTGLSSAQLRDIYAGEVTDWAGVGGAAGPIRAFQRPRNSGSQTMFMNLLMGDIEPVNAPAEWYLSEMGALIDSVAAYDNADSALGYSMYYFVSNMYVDWRVRMLAVDGVAPGSQTISDGSYPLCTAYYAVFSKELPADHPARALVDWLLTDEGQRMAQAAGYVPLRALPPPSIAPSKAESGGAAFGTGGAASRWGEPPRYTDPVWRYVGSQAGPEAWDDDTLPLVVSLPDQPGPEAEINAWLGDTRRLILDELGDAAEIYTQANQAGNLLALSMFGSREDEAYRWTWSENHVAVYDLVKGERLRLSGVFYDGFDYAGYLNPLLAALSLGDDNIFGDGDEPVAPFQGLRGGHCPRRPERIRA